MALAAGLTSRHSEHVPKYGILTQFYRTAIFASFAKHCNIQGGVLDARKSTKWIYGTDVHSDNGGCDLRTLPASLTVCIKKL